MTKFKYAYDNNINKKNVMQNKIKMYERHKIKIENKGKWGAGSNMGVLK